MPPYNHRCAEKDKKKTSKKINPVVKLINQFSQRAKTKTERQKHGQNPQKEEKCHQKNFSFLAKNGSQISGQKNGDAAWRE